MVTEVANSPTEARRGRATESICSTRHWVPPTVEVSLSSITEKWELGVQNVPWHEVARAYGFQERPSLVTPGRNRGRGSALLR